MAKVILGEMWQAFTAAKEACWKTREACIEAEATHAKAIEIRTKAWKAYNKARIATESEG